jgi:hypothetical protein
MENERETRGGGTAELLRNDGAGEPVGSKPRTMEERGVPLLTEGRTAEFRQRWEDCQRGFVDEPRESVERADELVADLIRDLVSQFSTERARLEEQWSQGQEVSTDDLRFALQRYRSFFNRLLAV